MIEQFLNSKPIDEEQFKAKISLNLEIILNLNR